MKTIYSERAAAELATQLTDVDTQLFWLERELGMGGQTLLRRAIEIAELECRQVNLAQCYPMDLEELFKSLPDKPGVIILDEYDRSDGFLVDLITFTLLYYEYRKMLCIAEGSVFISPKWKFIITTEPNAWIPSPSLHRRLCKIQ